MKRIFLLFLALNLLVLMGCSNRNRDEANYPPIPAPKVTSTLPENISTPPAETHSEVASTLPTESIAEKTYYFSEMDKLLGPGPFSINGLIEVFGEPIKTFGTIISMSSGDIGIITEFEGISFVLVANNGEKLSFDFNSIMDDVYKNAGENVSEYELTNFDKAVLIKPFETTITGALTKLPRNIQIGDSKQKVINAYDGDNGDEREHEGQLIVSYLYRPDVIESFTSDETFNLETQTGTVDYYFEKDSLVQVRISWYNGYLAFD